ncbi:hypothetical protein M405DRAFT_859947 [Rhizopogon salebrosus TDB-379]|nr:hypothetical protein M405DRAFT_859947 [Rhizopogon salebrosus TDB-379]
MSFQDRDATTVATRVLTDEEKALLDQDWVGRNGTKRKLELIMGRQKLKKTFQYEVKWRGLDHKFNSWVPRDDLMTKGFGKLPSGSSRSDLYEKCISALAFSQAIYRWNARNV